MQPSVKSGYGAIKELYYSSMILKKQQRGDLSYIKTIIGLTKINEFVRHVCLELLNFQGTRRKIIVDR